MSLTRFGFIVVGAQLDAWQELTSPSFTMITAGVAKVDLAPASAVRLVAEGVQLIELCGAFGPVWTARVIEAIEARVPVGAVGYGPEALRGLAAIFL